MAQLISLAPLRHRSFRLVWMGAVVSNIGGWMQTVAAGILVTQTTGQAQWTGLVAAASFAPAVVLGPIGGALADRVARKRLFLATTSAEAALAGLLALLAARGTPSPAAVTLLIFAGGCASALGSPAYAAILPDLVPREDLLGAISLTSAQWNLGRVVGPLMAGVAISLGGFGWAFGVNALSFLAVIGAWLAIRLPSVPVRSGESMIRRIVEGARFARCEPGVRAAIGSVALFSLLAGPFIALVPAMAITVLHTGAAGTSALVTAQGLGAVSMSLVLGPLADRNGRGAALMATMALLPPVLIAYAWSPSELVAALSIFVLGGLYLSLLSGLSSVVQMRVPPHLRGRVLSLHSTALSTFYPTGAVLQGTLAGHFGLRATTTATALVLGLALVGVRLVRPGAYAALREDAVVERPES